MFSVEVGFALKIKTPRTASKVSRDVRKMAVDSHARSKLLRVAAS